MRIAIVSDIHGNLTALEAVLADLRETSPDLVLHGGDLADGGARPAEVVERVRDLGWKGVAGNADEMLWDSQSLKDFANQSSNLDALFAAVEEVAAASREALGQERIAWLCELPRMQLSGPIALVHASPSDLWRAPTQLASDASLGAVYGPLVHPVVAYAHIHWPYIRKLPGMTVTNTGAVSLSYDGDCRASYLLSDGVGVEIRRVEYDIDKEVRCLSESAIPHADWIARMLRSAQAMMP